MYRFEFATPPKIKHVYHYQRFESGWIESLVNERRIRFSSPMAFNDPWDCKPCYNKSIVDNPVELERHVDAFVEAHRRHKPNISEEDRQALRRKWLSDPDLVKSAIDVSAAETAAVIDQRYKVYCVGTKPNCQLMWAHYGASHSGICLEFSTENEVFSGAIKVEYLEEFKPHDFLAGGGQNLLPLITKSSAWSYEGEYRLIAEENRLALAEGTLRTADNFFTIPENALTTIIMGARITPENRSWLERFIGQSDARVALKVARTIPDKYELAIS